MNANGHATLASHRPPLPGTRRAAESNSTYRATPMVVVALDARGAAAAAAFQEEFLRLSLATPRPIGVAVLEEAPPARAWPALEAALAEAVAGLPLDARRRIGMHWEAVLVCGPGPMAARVRGLLHHWAAHSPWPLRATWLLDVSALCRPWDDGNGRARAWEDVARDLRDLEHGLEQPGLGWNGAYLVGSGNRFGFVAEETFAPRYLACLLTALAASDLPDWLQALPTFCAGGAWAGEGAGVLRVSAIGVSALWHPPPPWRGQAVAVQAHRRALAYASDRRLGNPVVLHRWLAAHVDHAGQLAALEARLLGRLLHYQEVPDTDPGVQCRELLARVTERQSRCLGPLGEEVERHGSALLAQLERALDAAGQELVLRGGIATFADTLAGLAGRLAAVRQVAARHQAGVQELLRVDGRLLAELLAAANARRIGLGQPRPAFFLLRWLQNWRRRRWLTRTVQALFRVLRGEMQIQIDAMLLRFCERAGDLLRYLGEDLRRFGADLEAAGQEWQEEARLAFVPPLPTDVAAVPFAAFERWVVERLGPVAEPPAEPLAAGASWREWDRERLKAALRAGAAEDVARLRARFERGTEACRPVADAAQLTALARLSQPLVPVIGPAYDAHPQHVFQRWMVPEEEGGRWRAVSLPGGEAVVSCGLPWPTAITVYRDLPLTALARDQDVHPRPSVAK
jgi:hypothetical protein